MRGEDKGESCRSINYVTLKALLDARQRSVCKRERGLVQFQKRSGLLGSVYCSTAAAFAAATCFANAAAAACVCKCVCSTREREKSRVVQAPGLKTKTWSETPRTRRGASHEEADGKLRVEKMSGLLLHPEGQTRAYAPESGYLVCGRLPRAAQNATQEENPRSGGPETSDLEHSSLERWSGCKLQEAVEAAEAPEAAEAVEAVEAARPKSRKGPKVAWRGSSGGSRGVAGAGEGGNRREEEAPKEERRWISAQQKR